RAALRTGRGPRRPGPVGRGHRRRSADPRRHPHPRLVGRRRGLPRQRRAAHARRRHDPRRGDRLLDRADPDEPGRPTVTTAALTRSTGTGRRRLTGAGGTRRRSAPYVFVLPFVAIFLAFSVYPLFYTARLSFTNWRGTGAAQWVGWDNYAYLLTSPAFWNSLGNSAVLWLLIVPFQLVLGVLTAVLLNSAKLRLRGLYRVAFIVPFVTPLVAVAQIWVVL